MGPSVGRAASLADVSCASSRFCVAVGTGDNGGGPPNTVVESWNGTEWSLIPSPNPEIVDVLKGVSCVSASFCVAVGNDSNLSEDDSLVELWNGTEWSVVPSPNRSSFSVLNGVSCVSAKHCVAVGLSATGTGVGLSASGTLVESWNGSTWSILESPNPEASGIPRLTGVSCVSARLCAAVGSDSTEGGPSQTLVETSKGGKGSIVPSANSASGVSYLSGVSCVSTESCFAVGDDEATPEGPSQALVESGGVQSWGLALSRLG